MIGTSHRFETGDGNQTDDQTISVDLTSVVCINQRRWPTDLPWEERVFETHNFAPPYVCVSVSSFEPFGTYESSAEGVQSRSGCGGGRGLSRLRGVRRQRQGGCMQAVRERGRCAGGPRSCHLRVARVCILVEVALGMALLLVSLAVQRGLAEHGFHLLSVAKCADVRQAFVHECWE
jgi:hypothetical protein